MNVSKEVGTVAIAAIVVGSVFGIISGIISFTFFGMSLFAAFGLYLSIGVLMSFLILAGYLVVDAAQEKTKAPTTVLST